MLVFEEIKELLNTQFQKDNDWLNLICENVQKKHQKKIDLIQLDLSSEIVIKNIILEGNNSTRSKILINELDELLSKPMYNSEHQFEKN
jgi:hypothetical protein